MTVPANLILLRGLIPELPMRAGDLLPARVYNRDTIVLAGVRVAAQLPVDHPARRLALDYIARFEAQHGAGSVSAFGAYTWDAGLLLGNAIPVALKTAAPGTPEFRQALRDALEATRGLADSNGIVNMSTTDHLGLDQRARVMVEIRDSKWVYEAR